MRPFFRYFGPLNLQLRNIKWNSYQKMQPGFALRIGAVSSLENTVTLSKSLLTQTFQLRNNVYEAW